MAHAARRSFDGVPTDNLEETDMPRRPVPALLCIPIFRRLKEPDRWTKVGQGIKGGQRRRPGHFKPESAEKFAPGDQDRRQREGRPQRPRRSWPARLLASRCG